MLQDMLERLESGIELGSRRLIIEKGDPGRFPEEKNAEILLGKERRHLLYVTLYFGRGESYMPWAELYGIARSVEGARGKQSFFGSGLELELLKLFSEELGKGGRIFVEYGHDAETNYGLNRSFPEPVTRLGNVLYGLGFTWFKDWYFPEGYMEGGMKLQAERAIDEEHREKHNASIEKGCRDFLDQAGEFDSHEYLDNAVERAKKILD